MKRVVPDLGEAPLSRRRLLTAGALGAASLSLPPDWSAAADWLTSRRPRLPAPARSGLDHIVVVTMENRSFDHLLGWLPNANGRQEGLTYRDRRGVPHSTYPLAPNFDGCGHRDPDHSHAGGLIEYNHGACDGFLRSASDLFAIGYYRRDDLPFLGRSAPAWTVCASYFTAVLGPTDPNRIFLNAGATDRLGDSDAPSSLPTIWDRLASRRSSGRYYTARSLGETILNRWGRRYERIIHPLEDFYRDCRSGQLPRVAYVDPRGSGVDDHPPADVRVGEWFLARIYQAVTTSPAWGRTLLIVNFDEWGGFFDHVAPPPVRDNQGRQSLRGFRVPCLLVSPFARP
ncbi:MAG TPA: alkaline phosphatase family protein, partial [Gaiellaceae bacterium]